MRQLVMLERQALGSVDRTYRILFRLAVPEARQAYYANPAATSLDRFAPEEEILALRAGQWVEQVESLTAPPGTSDAQAFAMLQGSHARRQAELVERNPFDRYGTSWDGNAWTVVEVP